MELKCVLIIGDGMSDLPVKELGNKTPLEVAKKPHMDYIAKNGQTGLLQTSYPSLPIGSIVAIMGIIGFNPVKYYPNGRASLEALAQGIKLNKNDIAFRCNIISINDEKIKDFTSGMIDYDTAAEIINSIEIKNEHIELYSGQSYRNILIFRDSEIGPTEIESFEPHSNIGKNIRDIMIKSITKRSKAFADTLNGIMLDSIKQIKKLNRKYKSKADMLWLWSPSSTPKIPNFYDKFGVRGSMVGGLDFLRGLAYTTGMETKKISGATGYMDSDLKEKLKAAKMFLKDNDFICIHINSPDEESHAKNIKNKILSIEKIDKEIIGPLLEFLNTKYNLDFRIAIMPDHYTLVCNGMHTTDPVPYVVYGKGIKKNSVAVYSENKIIDSAAPVKKSYEFMKYLLSRET